MALACFCLRLCLCASQSLSIKWRASDIVANNNVGNNNFITVVHYRRQLTIVASRSLCQSPVLNRAAADYLLSRLAIRQSRLAESTEVDSALTRKAASTAWPAAASRVSVCEI